jgi:N-acetylmuramoyl-L-alanine amidase
VKLIRRGDEGGRVADVQHRLVLAGFPIPEDEHGSFGDGTENAVRAFQQARGLIVDGIIGVNTWRDLVEATWRLGDRSLYLRSPHMRGDDVRALQDNLNTLGFNAGRVDGIFGPRTLNGLQEFQRNYGLPADGVVGTETVRAFQGLPRLAGDTPSSVVRERMKLRPRAAGLAGLRVVLDPGHGGPDPGHTGPAGAHESDIAFEMTRHVEAALAVAGALPFLTRARDAGPDEHTRAILANTLEADIFLSVHLAGAEPLAAGAATYYFGHERFVSAGGQALAELLLDEVCGLGLVDGRAHPKTYPELRDTRMTAVIVEVAHITNPDEEKRATDPGFQRAFAEAVVRAIRRFTEAGESVP